MIDQDNLYTPPTAPGFMAKPVIPPTFIDLVPPGMVIKDQGAQDSSTAHAVLAAVTIKRRQAGLYGDPDWSPAYLHWHANETADGKTIKQTLHRLTVTGALSEQDWATATVLPGDEVPEHLLTLAKRDLVKKAQRVPVLHSALMGALAAGEPVIAQISLPEEFRWGKPLPDATDGMEMPIRYTAVIIGYNLIRQAFVCLASFGSDWGQGGKFLLPFSYLRGNQVREMWVIGV